MKKNKLMKTFKANSVQRTVGKSGIRINGTEYFSMELLKHVGSVADCMIAEDISLLFVIANNEKLIAEAPMLKTSKAVFNKSKKKAQKLMKKSSTLIKRWSAYSTKQDKDLKTNLMGKREYLQIENFPSLLIFDTDKEKVIFRYLGEDESVKKVYGYSHIHGELLS